VDIRLVSATNLDPKDAIRTLGFREDLLHRLEVLRIDIPPLRRRKGDIAILARHFLDLFRREFHSTVEAISPDALQLMKQYDWPGNLRELKNVVAQGAILAEEGEIQTDHLPSRITEPVVDALTFPDSAPQPSFARSREGPGGRFPGDSGQVHSVPTGDGVFFPVGFSLDEVEKAYVLKTLSACGNNKTRTARILGISRKALYDKLAKWGLLERTSAV